MLFDGGELAGKPSVDQSGREAVEPGKQSLGKADMAFRTVVAQGRDDVGGNRLGRIAVALQVSVEGVDGGRVERRVDRTRCHMHHPDQRIGEFPPQCLGKGAQSGFGRRLSREAG